MTDWAAKVLEGVDRYTDIHTTDDLPVVYLDEVIAAIARMGAGDGLVERAEAMVDRTECYQIEAGGQFFNVGEVMRDLLAHIAALNAKMETMIESDIVDGWLNAAQPIMAEACRGYAEAIADLTAERDSTCRQLARSDQENDALRERVARLEGALRGLHHAVCGETGFAACVRLDSGKAYPWPALDAADDAARAALTDGGKDG